MPDTFDQLPHRNSWSFNIFISILCERVNRRKPLFKIGNPSFSFTRALVKMQKSHAVACSGHMKLIHIFWSTCKMAYVAEKQHITVKTPFLLEVGRNGWSQIRNGAVRKPVGVRTRLVTRVQDKLKHSELQWSSSDPSIFMS